MERIKYRNGKTGRILTDTRRFTIFSLLTMRDEDDTIVHHLENGCVNIGGHESEWDIVNLEEK